MDEDECLSIILSMGFPNIEEIKKALRYAKNDVNEAVAILTNEQPINVDDLSVDIDMKDVSRRGTSSHCDKGPDDIDELREDDGKGMEFPTHNLYELEQRVFQDNWSIPYKRDESLGRCLVSATNLARENLMEADDNCKKFIDRVMPEAFKKLLTSSATHRWQAEIQEGIFNMLELYIDLVVTRLQHDPIPVHLLNILAMAFDIKNGWNSKNREQSPKGRWSDAGGRNLTPKDFARPIASTDTFCRDQFGWLCDLVNQFGDNHGFEIVQNCVMRSDATARTMAALLHPLANCSEILVKETVTQYLSPCMDKAFRYVEQMDEVDLKSKEVSAVSDLLGALKLLCSQFCPDEVKNCDRLRLSTICRMLQTPLFNSKMNALKEVSRLIEESESSTTATFATSRRNNGLTISHIGVDEVVEWMAENKVLTIALEGNIDQVQYTDRIKSIVEFLGPRLSLEELTKMWNLQDSPNPHVMDNVHAIMSSAASKFSLSQFEHLTWLIKEKWGKSNDRVREKLLVFIGQIGREAKQIKSTQAILQLLWDVSHLDSLPKHLIERALSEQLAILTDMTLNKDANRKTYINRCVEDIKSDGICVLPAVNHLHKICKSYTKGTTIYSKADKATLGNLNEQHGIVKLLCNSLRNAHKTAEKYEPQPFKPETVIDGRYTHEEYVRGHLDLMKFFLKEGDLYLSWGRCQEIWETLVSNARAITFDRDLCFEWFEICLSDLENDTQKDFFQKMLLQVAPTDLTTKGFDCFKAYFESVNHTEGKLRKGTSPPYTVESMDLSGLDFLWNLITDCTREDIADLAIDYFLQKTYLAVNAKLKKDSISLHQNFIESCYTRLEQVFYPDDQKMENVQEVFEIEMTMSGDPLESAPDVSARKAKTEVFKVSSFSDDANKCQKLQRIRRLLLLAERYVSTIESTYANNRIILPHAALFRGRPLKIKVINDAKKEEFIVESHTNEMVCDVKRRIADTLKQPGDQLNISCNDVTLGNNKDRCLVGFIGLQDGRTWVVKSQGMATSASSSTALVVYDEGVNDAPQTSVAAVSARQAVMNEQEKTLPGVVMASGGRCFTMLYQLANLSDSRILQGIRRLIHLIPTDPSVSEALDAISYHSNTQPLASADASPKLSPRSKKVVPSNLEDAKKQLAELFDASAEGMSAFRVLYNLEVLSGKLLPTKVEAAPKFSNDFLEAGGLRVILNIFHHDALPADVNCDIRQSIYLVALQLSCYLLCGEGIGPVQPQIVPVPPSSPIPKPNPLTSPIMKPTPPKKSALDAASVGKSPVVASSSRVVQTMQEKEFSDVVSCLMRIVWAAAAGNLQLAASALPNPVASEQQSASARLYVCRRSSHSSTGSSGSTGSDGQSGAAVNHTADSLHPGVCVQQSFVHPGDSQIAGEALQLLVTCLQLRSNNMSFFYNMSMVSDFVIDTVLGSPSESVRRRACDEFQRLSRIRLTARALNLDDSIDSKSTSHRLLSPKQFLTKTILKTPVPLWMPSCKARGISHAILAQCTEYFDLRAYLLGEMSLREQECLGMTEDELNFLHNYTPCHRAVDCTFVAGHLRLVEALLLCEGVDKVAVGDNLIKQLLNVYLFPSSRLIADGALNNGGLMSIDLTEARNINPKCDTPDSRVAAYSLLVELARNCAENTTMIVEELIRMHHTYNESLSKEFEYEPPIERRAVCNFVGLKNAGATCYMNSVLQQLYNVPNISDQILNIELDSVDEETVFYQLQNVFGHLLESKLQYYVPEKFWRTFRLFGQPVNVREQQDAFEFFTQIVDQVDEYLASQGKPKVFSRHFEGVFSDQKICQGCPHRYEREQTFMALNLTVKSNNLQESLDQFVKGELLEGDNAYFCEKCHEKRNAIKRMCIRSLPQTLVIQLKRFHYDWETNRALKFDDFFQFPWTIDMGPYTTEGIQGHIL